MASFWGTDPTKYYSKSYGLYTQQGNSDKCSADNSNGKKVENEAGTKTQTYHMGSLMVGQNEYGPD